MSSKCLTGTDEPTSLNPNFLLMFKEMNQLNPIDIKKIINAKYKYPNHVICGYDNISKFENPSNLNLPKVLVNEKKN